MYNLFLDTLEKLGIVAPKWFFWIVLAVVILIGVNFLLKKWVKPIFDNFNDLQEKLKKTDEIDILKENQLRNVEHYKAADKEIRKEIKEVSDKVSVVAAMIIEMQAKLDSSNVARLKNQIREIYSVHHRSQIITKMELEALENLIDDYISSGGNGFVEHTVLPEIYCWEIVDDDYYEQRHREEREKNH